MPSEPIISLTTDDLSALLISMLASQQPSHKVVLLAPDPGTVVTHILQREGYQVGMGFSLEVVAEVLASKPDLIIIEPKLLAQLLRAGGNSQG